MNPHLWLLALASSLLLACATSSAEHFVHGDEMRVQCPEDGRESPGAGHTGNLHDVSIFFADGTLLTWRTLGRCFLEQRGVVFEGSDCGSIEVAPTVCMRPTAFHGTRVDDGRAVNVVVEGCIRLTKKEQQMLAGKRRNDEFVE